jgi:hypothetical protein
MDDFFILVGLFKIKVVCLIFFKKKKKNFLNFLYEFSLFFVCYFIFKMTCNFFWKNIIINCFKILKRDMSHLILY